MPVRAPKSLMIVGLLLAVAVVAGAVKIMAEGSSQGGRGRFEQSVPVAVASVKPADFVDRINALGTAKANESVSIAAKVTETVHAVSFNDGDKVEAGTVLVELASGEDTASLHAARSALKEAENNYQRSSNLLKTGSATRAMVDQSAARRDAALGQVQATESRLADRLIKAPFAGILGLRQVSQGTLVRPGDVITTLDDVSVIKLDFTVPETYLSVLRAGLDIETKTPAFPGKTFTGKIIAVDTRIDPVTRAVMVRAAVANPDLTLRAGILMTVEVIRSRTRALAVLQRALVAETDKLFVYRIKGDAVEKVAVTTDHRQNDMAEITSGVAENDLIVIDGMNRVRDGQKVQIVEKDGVAVKPPTRPGRPES